MVARSSPFADDAHLQASHLDASESSETSASAKTAERKRRELMLRYEASPLLAANRDGVASGSVRGRNLRDRRFL
jgi:hypothetical protein